MKHSKTKTITSPLAKVRGLGSAHNGTHHWVVQRVTAIAMVPLLLWLLTGFAQALAAGNVESLKIWAAGPFNAIALLLFMVAMLHHARLGLQVIIEDYCHCACLKTGFLLFNTFGSIFLMLVAAISIAKLHFA